MPLQKEPQSNLISVSSGHRENWGESNMAEASPRTDTSTDDTEDKNQRVMLLLSALSMCCFLDTIEYHVSSILGTCALFFTLFLVIPIC